MVSLSHAEIIVSNALNKARSDGFPPMTVAVLDAHGCLVSFRREDGSSLLRESIAQGKAWGALGMGTGSRGLAARAAKFPAFFVSLSDMSGGRIVPVPGGVLIRNDDGGIIGAVGVSGSVPDQDEACALCGIAAAGLSSDPGSDDH